MRDIAKGGDAETPKGFQRKRLIEVNLVRSKPWEQTAEASLDLLFISMNTMYLEFHFSKINLEKG